MASFHFYFVLFHRFGCTFAPFSFSSPTPLHPRYFLSFGVGMDPYTIVWDCIWICEYAHPRMCICVPLPCLGHFCVHFIMKPSTKHLLVLNTIDSVVSHSFGGAAAPSFGFFLGLWYHVVSAQIFLWLLLCVMIWLGAVDFLLF
eukprot:894452_1